MRNHRFLRSSRVFRPAHTSATIRKHIIRWRGLFLILLLLAGLVNNLEARPARAGASSTATATMLGATPTPATNQLSCAWRKWHACHRDPHLDTARLCSSARARRQWYACHRDSCPH